MLSSAIVCLRACMSAIISRWSTCLTRCLIMPRCLFESCFCFPTRRLAHPRITSPRTPPARPRSAQHLRYPPFDFPGSDPPSAWAFSHRVSPPRFLGSVPRFGPPRLGPPSQTRSSAALILGPFALDRSNAWHGALRRSASSFVDLGRSIAPPI